MVYKVYTDGSARRNGYPDSVGGWAFSFETPDGYEVWKNGAEVGATNQQMELRAAIEGLQCVFGKFYQNGDSVEVYTDSAYLHNCRKAGWYKNWQMNDWVNAKKQPVANRELWEVLIPYFKHEAVTFHKVKGHAGGDIPMNDRVDALATNASMRLYKETYG